MSSRIDILGETGDLLPLLLGVQFLSKLGAIEKRSIRRVTTPGMHPKRFDFQLLAVGQSSRYTLPGNYVLSSVVLDETFSATRWGFRWH